jgi:hypothetical protein
LVSQEVTTDRADYLNNRHNSLALYFGASDAFTEHDYVTIYIYIYIYIYIQGPPKKCIQHRYHLLKCVYIFRWTLYIHLGHCDNHTQRCTTVGRTPLDELSARRRDLYLTTHNTTHKHQCPQWDSNLQFQQVTCRRPRP